ncbi:MAG: hypothetical protein KJ061_20835, partial [Vicinamibacteraceae bacterium]|nr:hypothetical protein [Vicinamibacteraceae bacterium]
RKVGFFVTLRIHGRAIEGADLHPYAITDTGLRGLEAREDREFRRLMARLSAPFASEGGHLRAWDAYLAHYGVEGFASEVTGILERMESEPQKGAAMFRNRVTTMQHAELWKDVLTRVMQGGRRTPPRDASRLVEEYFTRRVDLSWGPA